MRVTPLPVRESPVGLLEWLPTLPVLSSDYPHFEGDGDPMGYYQKELASVSDEVRAQFFGDNIADCFARSSSPLTSTAATPSSSGRRTTARTARTRCATTARTCT